MLSTCVIYHRIQYQCVIIFNNNNKHCDSLTSLIVRCSSCVIETIALSLIRFRVYVHEKLRKRRLIGECIFYLSSLEHDAKPTTHWLTLEPRTAIAVSLLDLYKAQDFRISGLLVSGLEFGIRLKQRVGLIIGNIIYEIFLITS